MGINDGNDKKSNKALLWVGLFVGLMVLWSAVKDMPVGSKPPDATTSPVGSPALASHPAAHRDTEWTYDHHESEMGLGPVNTASILSSNTVSFDFPYRGAQHATLSIRSHPQYGKDIIFSIARGQILIRSYGNDTVSLRFDAGKPMRVRALEPKDHSSTTIFLMGYDNLVAQVKKSKILRIQVPVYQEGEPVFEFNVSGLNWPMKK
jgi:hypothetical protein